MGKFSIVGKLVGGLLGGDDPPPAPPPPPPAPTPLPPEPTREDPAVDRARREQERAALRRRGRAASMLAGDDPDGLGTISRPQAGGRAAQTLGNVGQG